MHVKHITPPTPLVAAMDIAIGDCCRYPYDGEILERVALEYAKIFLRACALDYVFFIELSTGKLIYCDKIKQVVRVNVIVEAVDAP